MTRKSCQNTSNTAAPTKKAPKFRMDDDVEEDAELTELYKMLSVTDSKTKELESCMQSMSGDMGKLEKTGHSGC